jgi:parallel beta-helix repeat protein
MDKVRSYLFETKGLLQGHLAAHARAAIASLPLVLLTLSVNANANVIGVSTTIQAAVDAAQPGDVVNVPPGTYRENVVVNRDNITIQGSPAAITDGRGLAGNTGITVAPQDSTKRISGFTLSGLTIQNYGRNGVLLQNVDGFRISDGVYLDNDEYGMFPILSSGGLIDHNYVSGSNDTGIYVGQCRDIVVRKNRAIDCTVGIEIEASSHIDVQNNIAKSNSVGMLVEVIPGLTLAVTSDVNLTGNRLLANNRPNPVTDPGELLSLVPSGIGILSVACQLVTIENNTAIGNQSAGIALAQLPPQVAALDSRINPFPTGIQVRGNVARRNGDAPDPKLSPLPGADLLWDLSGSGNCWTGNAFSTSFPTLPACP